MFALNLLLGFTLEKNKKCMRFHCFRGIPLRLCYTVGYVQTSRLPRFDTRYKFWPFWPGSLALAFLDLTLISSCQMLQYLQLLQNLDNID